MSATGFQDLAAGLLVMLALAWLVRRALRRRSRPTPFCGECPGCATAADPHPASAGVERAGFVPLSEFGGRAMLGRNGRDPGHAAR